MRYGNPSIASALKMLEAENCEKVLVLPLYPQFASSSTGTAIDAVSREITKWRKVPELGFINCYNEEGSYIQSLANSVKEFQKIHGVPDLLLMSYHGIPKRYFEEGDPYHCFCQKTSRLVAEALGLEESQYITSFQSRLAAAGREWLKPYTSELMKKLPKEGIKKILILSPGFSMDCLETIEEIDEENKEIFLDSGGEAFHYIACLNDNNEHVEAINNLITNKISQL
jgi:ferrochelatase